MCRRKKEEPEFHFVIESTIFCIFMTFSVMAMVISAFYTVVDLLFYE